MIDKKTPEEIEINDDDDDKGGSTGGEGSLAPKGDVWIPGFDDFNQIGIIDNEEENLSKILAPQALFENRMSVRAKEKIEVTALSKAQEQRQKQRNKSNLNAEQTDGGGLGLASHPELADMGGEVDPNHIVLPESEKMGFLSKTKSDPKLQHKLQQKLAQKFGMGSIGGLSKEALEAEYKKKMKIKESPEPKPRFSPQRAPKPPMQP